MRSLLRDRNQHEAKVSPVELFFDLVFVFAITQLSHSLLADFSAIGALQAAMLFLGVWWVWIFTAWVTNWLDPDRAPVRLLLFALMVAGLFMSMAIPDAFGERGEFSQLQADHHLARGFRRVMDSRRVGAGQ